MIDETDKKIIDLLKENARLSVRMIAKKLGLSPAAVSKRMNKLKKKGVIKKYTVILDEKYLESACNLMLLIHLNRETDPDKFAQELSRIKEICWCVRVTGYYEIIAISSCSRPIEVNDLLKRIKRIGGISEITTSLIISKYKMAPIIL